MIEAEEVVAKTGYTRPHTVHCMPGDNIVVPCWGTRTATAPAGSPSSTRKLSRSRSRWENGGETPRFNYDFWYQPRKNLLVSSEFGEPNA